MSTVKVPVLRTFSVYEPAGSPSEKETRRDFEAGTAVEVTPDQARDWRDRGLVGGVQSVAPANHTPEE